MSCCTALRSCPRENSAFFLGGAVFPILGVSFCKAGGVERGASLGASDSPTWAFGIEVGLWGSKDFFFYPALLHLQVKGPGSGEQA